MRAREIKSHHVSLSLCFFITVGQCVCCQGDTPGSKQNRAPLTGIQGVEDLGLHDVALHSSGAITNVFNNTPLAPEGSL